MSEARQRRWDPAHKHYVRIERLQAIREKLWALLQDIDACLGEPDITAFATPPVPSDSETPTDGKDGERCPRGPFCP